MVGLNGPLVCGYKNRPSWLLFRHSFCHPTGFPGQIFNLKGCNFRYWACSLKITYLAINVQRRKLFHKESKKQAITQKAFILKPTNLLLRLRIHWELALLKPWTGSQVMGYFYITSDCSPIWGFWSLRICIANGDTCCVSTRRLFSWYSTHESFIY